MDRESPLVFRQTLALFSISSFGIAFLSSGALLTEKFNEIGPSNWKFPLMLVAEILVGVLLFKGFTFVLRRR